jgi:hypothetical protein
MATETYAKTLTANDVGQSGGHQAGIHIPKSQADLIRMLPQLDPRIKNPDAWLTFIDEHDVRWEFRYIHYNNSLHDPGGTRDEYRITHMTNFFRLAGAKPGDFLILSGEKGSSTFRISVSKPTTQPAGGPVRLQGWRRVH